MHALGLPRSSSQPIRTRRTTGLALAIALAAAACGGSNRDNTTTGGRGTIAVDQTAPDEEKVVVLVEGLASNVTAAGGECGEVAAAIVGWVDKYSGPVADLTQRVEAGNRGVANPKIDELGARLDRAWDTVFAAAKPCEAQVRPAINRLDAMFGL
jgi:hypothetical protein